MPIGGPAAVYCGDVPGLQLIEKPDAVSGNAAFTAARWPLSGLAAAHDYEKGAPHDGTTVRQGGCVCPRFVQHANARVQEYPLKRVFLRPATPATPTIRDLRPDP